LPLASGPQVKAALENELAMEAACKAKWNELMKDEPHGQE
jgi:hypothetical protein